MTKLEEKLLAQIRARLEGLDVRASDKLALRSRCGSPARRSSVAFVLTAARRQIFTPCA